MPGGRPSKPTNIKLLHGNPGKRPLNDAEPKPDASDQKPPTWLKGRARREWKRIAPMVADMGVLTVADNDAAALMCDALAEYIEAREVVRQHGATYEAEAKNGAVIVRPRPEVGMYQDAWRRVLRMMTDFGMTPSSRAKVQAGEKKSEDPFEEFMNGSRRTS